MVVKHFRMQPSTLLVGSLVALSACGITYAQDLPSGVTMFNASQVQWASQSATPGAGQSGGVQSATIYGDPSKPGPYLYVAKVGPSRLGEGASSRPHTHPDNRTYTVIAGTWYVGFGTELDESKLIALPAGSYYTEPAGVPHFVLVKEDTIVQIGGTGPTRLIPVESVGSASPTR